MEGSQGPVGRERDRRVMETGRCSARSRTWTGWRRGPAGPCSPLTGGQGGAPVQRAGGGGRQAPVRAQGPKGDPRISTGASGFLLRERDGLRIDRNTAGAPCWGEGSAALALAAARQRTA